MTFTKKEMLIMLTDIKNKYDVPIDKYEKEVIENDIPSNALKFINLYTPLKDLGVFNLIYSKRHKTPLFHNFKKGNVDDYEQVVCLGSLLTQMLCYIKTTKDDIIKHSQIVGANSILDAINDFINTGSFDKVNMVYNEFSNLFKDLFNKDGEN